VNRTKTSRRAMETVEAAHPRPHPGKPCGFPTAPTVPTTSTTTARQGTKKPDLQTVTHVPGLNCHLSARPLRERFLRYPWSVPRQESPAAHRLSRPDPGKFFPSLSPPLQEMICPRVVQQNFPLSNKANTRCARGRSRGLNPRSGIRVDPLVGTPIRDTGLREWRSGPRGLCWS